MNHPTEHLSTEEKIKAAAREVFLEKGFAATRTRDIAEAADINLALLNYYFRSKEKLYDIIAIETVNELRKSIFSGFNDPKTTLKQKLQIFVDEYVDLVIEQPHLPAFILNEINNRPDELMQMLHNEFNIRDSYFAKQFHNLVKKGKIKNGNIDQFILNMFSLTVFPFAAARMMKFFGKIDEDVYREMLLERKKLIPLWLKSILKT